MNSTFPKPVIDPIADALINRNVIDEHPELRPLLTRPTNRCAFDGRPSVVVVTGKYGQRLGQCATCATAHETAGETPAERDARIDQFAERMLDAIRDPEAYWQQRGGNGPREHAEPGLDTVTILFGPCIGAPSNGEPTEYWPTPDMDAYAFEGIYDPTQISLTEAEARVRSQLAAQGLQVGFLYEGPAPTAAERGGPDWIARYGCPGTWCDMTHDGPDGEPGWHQGRTIQVTAPTSTFGTPDSREPESTVLAARINQTTDHADAFGVETEVWLDVDNEVLHMNAPQFRALLAQLRKVLPEWEAMAGQAERLAVADHPGNPVLRAQFMAELDAHIKAVDEGRSCGCRRCTTPAGGVR